MHAHRGRVDDRAEAGLRLAQALLGRPALLDLRAEAGDRAPQLRGRVEGHAHHAQEAGQEDAHGEPRPRGPRVRQPAPRVGERDGDAGGGDERAHRRGAPRPEEEGGGEGHHRVGARGRGAPGPEEARGRRHEEPQRGEVAGGGECASSRGGSGRRARRAPRAGSRTGRGPSRPSRDIARTRKTAVTAPLRTRNTSRSRDSRAVLGLPRVGREGQEPARALGPSVRMAFGGFYATGAGGSPQEGVEGLWIACGFAVESPCAGRGRPVDRPRKQRASPVEMLCGKPAGAWTSGGRAVDGSGGGAAAPTS